MKKNVKLYNVIFPVWFLILWPPMWLLVLPVNFGIDTLVLYIANRVMGLGQFKEVFKRTILKIWLFGFLADIVGGVLLFGITTLDPASFSNPQWISDLTRDISYQPYQQPLAIVITVACLIVSGVLIYLLNRHFSFNTIEITLKQKRRLSLVIAIFTAPMPF